MGRAFGKNPLNMAARQYAGMLILFQHNIHQRPNMNVRPVLAVHTAFFPSEIDMSF
jgi:hypothetical protein